MAAATGHDWQHWHAVLDSMGATALPHKEIAARLAREHGVRPWWSQMITVEFERSTGRRTVGQRHDGAYAAGASRTLPLSQDDALAAWAARARRHADCDGVALAGPPRTSRTEKWRYWRIALEDGTRVTVLVAPKGPDKAVIGVDHEGVTTPAAAARWKVYWRKRLAELGT